MPSQGVRLQLMIGPTVPVPAPYLVMDAFISLEVTNHDQNRDGFQITFSIGKNSLLDYGLLSTGLLDPPSRMIIIVQVGGLQQVLIDGVITNHQVMPNNRPGESTLIVTGEDISLMLDLEDKNDTHPNQSDSAIVTQLLSNYATHGITPRVSSTNEIPDQVDRVPAQHGTDLAYIRELAHRNGFVFYIEPTLVPGQTTAYWGLDNRLGLPQRALTMNMGADTTVDQPIRFSFNALGPANPQVSVVELQNRNTISIPAPNNPRPPLARQPAVALRKPIARDVAKFSSSQGALRALSASSQSSDAVTGTGELDAVRYGRALLPRRLVDVGGVGASYDGTYYVREVQHRIRRGEYKQSFTITREGRGALKSSMEVS